MTTLFNISHSPNLENFTLVWLDSLVNISQENLDAKLLFRKAINPIKTFDDGDKCIEYIRSVFFEKFVLIASGRLGQAVVRQIHEWPQVMAIYIYCSDRQRNETWANDFIKVKGVIVDLNELITRIQSDQTKRNEYKIDEPLPISIFFTNSSEKHDLMIDNDYFIYFQLLIDCLSRMKSNSNDRQALMTLIKDEYKKNETELQIVDEFEEKYISDRAIWWFTRDCCLSQMLNKALDDINIDILYTFHFLIRDIQEQLKENQCLSSVCTYRAQLMSDEEIEILRSSIGQYISINTFLLTTSSRQRALALFDSSDTSNDLQKVLFKIDAEPLLNDIKPFCNITALNYYTSNEIIMFMAGTIFQLVDIYEKDSITIIQIEACDDRHQTMRTAFEDMKTELYHQETNLLSLAHLLLKMKKFTDAKKCYNRVLHNMPHDHHSVARCYQGLGHIAMEKHDYDACLRWYQKALDTNQLVLRSEDPEIAFGYNNLANTYVKKGVYNEALELYTQALRIWTYALGKDHPKVAMCYEDMAFVYEMNEQYSETLESFKKALAIRKKNLTADHPDVLLTMRNIGLVYEILHDFNQALSYFEKVASKYHQLLPLDHPDVTQISQDIQRISSHINNNSSLSVDF